MAGPVTDISLELARQRAAACRVQLLEGTDPIESAAEQRRQAKIDRAKRVTFGERCEKYIEAHESGWRNAKHADQWRSPLSLVVSGKAGTPSWPSLSSYDAALRGFSGSTTASIPHGSLAEPEAGVDS